VSGASEARIRVPIMPRGASASEPPRLDVGRARPMTGPQSAREERPPLPRLRNASYRVVASTSGRARLRPPSASRLTDRVPSPTSLRVTAASTDIQA